MPRIAGAKARSLAVVALIIILSVPSQFMAYNITTFTDGVLEKTLVFTDSQKNGTVLFAIPRATNLSEASISLTGSASIVNDEISFSDFSTGNGTNITLNNDLKLSSKDDWWNNSWTYRASLDLLSTRDRSNVIVEKELNLSEILGGLGLGNRTVSGSSVRIVERLSNGSLAPFNLSVDNDSRFLLPASVQNMPGYNAAGNARVYIKWLVPGETMASQSRRFELYFNSAAHPEMPNPDLPRDYPEVFYSNSKGPSPQQSPMYENANGSFVNVPKLNFRIGTAMGVNHNDINSDGYPDVIFPVFRNGTYFNATSRVFFGGQNGIDNGTYMGIETLGAYDVAIDDLNKDGYQDLVFACHQNFSNYEIQSMAFYGGQSGFNAGPDELFNTTGAAAVAIGDFNRDGWKDIVFACERNATTGNIGSQVYFGGSQGFSETPDVLLPTEAGFGVAVADLNLDGWLDIIFANNRNTSLTPPNDILITSSVYYGNPAGFNSTPDVNLDTSGAMDVLATDLNLDGWPDIIFANYADGMTTRTLSCAYFGSASGFDPHTPGAWFQTAWAFGVDVGDVNLDGNPDVAFANYFDGSTYAINSTIFYGPCVGLKSTPSVKLPTIGATEVVIADVDRYYMSTDRNPPAMTIGTAEGRYVADGAYISPATVVDEKIITANVTWSATVPVQPPGCNVSVYLSNDGGGAWTKVVKGQQFNFTTEGKTLKYRVEIVSDMYNIDTPIFQDITINCQKESLPHNVSLDVNSDGRNEWSYPGRFNGTVILNESTMGLATLLMGYVPRVGSGNFSVPIKFSSDSPGVLKVWNLVITGNYRPELIQALPEISMIENIPRQNVFNVNNYFRHLDEDKLIYTTIGNWNILVNISVNGSVDLTARVGWYGDERFTLRATDAFGEYADLPVEVDVAQVVQSPRFTGKLPDVNLAEGDTARGVFNLFDYVLDPDTPKTALIFSVADVSNGNISVDMDINQNVNVYSKAGWYGNATVRMKVSDTVLSDYATFNVTVEHRVQPNPPPVLGQLPPFQLLQGSRIDHAFNLFNYTTYANLSKLTFRIEENSNPDAGVSIDTDGWVNIRPVAKFSGIAFLVINVSDGQASARSSLTVTVMPKSATTETKTDNTLMYALIVLMVVLLLLVAVDVGMRSRKKPSAARPEETGSSAAALFVGSEHPEKGGEVPPIPKKAKKAAVPARPVEKQAEQAQAAPAEEKVETLQVEEGQAAAPSLESSGDASPQPTGTQADLAAIMGTSEGGQEQGGEGYTVVTAEEPPGERAMEPVGAEAPPENVPDMTPSMEAATWEGDAQRRLEEAAAPRVPEPPTFQFEPEAPPAPPAEQAPPGEVEQKPHGKSALALLAELQKAKTKVDVQPEAGGAQATAEAEAPLPEAPTPQRQARRTVAEEPEAAETEQAVSPQAGQEGGPPADKPAGKPITRVRCAGCKAAIPIYSAQRPLVVTCPQCGRMGMLK